uniref:Glutamate decarboxylase-like protein 1 n=1 Tax=Bactrocera latifrons TaxID=174628 RepID=A0A0K8UXR7_BACLA
MIKKFEIECFIDYDPLLQITHIKTHTYVHMPNIFRSCYQIIFKFCFTPLPFYNVFYSFPCKFPLRCILCDDMYKIVLSNLTFPFIYSLQKNGLFSGQQLIIFTSQDAHYSVEKLAMFMGFGSESVCKIETDQYGKMDIGDLETKVKHYINKGARPLMVSATAGTTVLGAFDDLNCVADICEKYNMWFHTDAAWGGGALITNKYRHLLNGIERSDSVTWNPHKMLIASQQCSTFLTRHKDILTNCHSTNATYLFQKDKFYDTSFDTGDKHIQCGRRADVYKFWFMWKAKGTNGLAEHVNQAFKMSEYITELIRERPGFELVL